jgi:hypothetical protein
MAVDLIEFSGLLARSWLKLLSPLVCVRARFWWDMKRQTEGSGTKENIVLFRRPVLRRLEPYSRS